MAKGDSLNRKRMFFKKSNLGTSERTNRYSKDTDKYNSFPFLKRFLDYV